MLSWGGIRGGEAFGLSWGRLQVLVGRHLGGVSGFGGEDLGLSWEIWAFVGGFGLVGRTWAFGFVGKDSGFRGAWGFVGIWVFVGVRAFVGKDSGFRIGFTNLRLRAAPLKRTDFANRIGFTRLGLRAAPFKEGVDLGAELRWRIKPPLNRRFKNIRFDEISA